MSISLRLAALGLAALAVGAATIRQSSAVSEFEGVERFETRERARIRSHFDSVLSELRDRDLSRMSDVHRARRERLIGVLGAYRERGLFPRNYDAPGQMVPTFVDERTGIRCAVAHLLESTGRGDIVQRVAETNQHVYVMELGTDTVFTEWLGENGLTLTEAARIQVPYIGDMGPDPEMARAAAPHRAAPAVTALVLATVGVSTWNLMHFDSPKARMGLAGIVVGTTSFLVGNEMGRADHIGTPLAKTAMIAGAGTALFGAATLLMPQLRTTNNTNRISVSPTIDFARPASPPALGFAGRLRF